MTPKDVLDTLQAIATIATPLTIVLTIRQLRLGQAQAKQQADNATVSFVLNSEGQFDSMHNELVGASTQVIRLAYGPEIDEVWNDDQLRTFVYLRRLYEHISRMIYIVNDTTIDIGMDARDRRTYAELWKRTIRKHDDNPIMQRIHMNAIRFKDYNERMLAISRDALKSAADKPTGSLQGRSQT